jgi:hypothetical protein
VSLRFSRLSRPVRVGRNSLPCRLWIGKFNLLRRNLQAPASVESDFSGYPLLVAKTNKPFELGLFDDPADHGHALAIMHQIPHRRFDLTFKVADQYVPEFLERRQRNRMFFHSGLICLSR